MPIHNEGKHLDQVFRCITKQDLLSDREIIAVLDACSDNSEEIARQYADKVIKVNFKNTSFALNTGFSMAKNHIMIVISGNTIVPRDYLRTLLKSFNGVDLVSWSKETKGLWCFSKETLSRFGYLKPMFNEDYEYIRRIRNAGGKVAILNGRHVDLKKTSLRRTFGYGVMDVWFMKVYGRPFKLFQKRILLDIHSFARFLGRLYGYLRFRKAQS